MHILIAIAGAAAAVYFFIIRARNSADVATDVLDMANDVRLAARRFGFRRRTNQHPVEEITDVRLSMTGLAVSFLELDDYPTQEARDALLIAVQSQFNISKSDATEMLVLGRWFMNECQGPSPAVSRLSRKTFKLDGADAFEPVMILVQSSVGPNGLSQGQRDALEDIKRAFGIR